MPITAIEDLTIEHIDALTSQISGFEEGMHYVASRMVDELINIAGDNRWQSVSLARQLVWIQRQLRGQLNQSGYGDLAARFVNNYDESQLFATQVFQRLGKMDQMLIPMPLETVQSLQAFDMSVFDEFGNDMIRKASRELVYSTVAGKSRAEVIKSLTGMMDGQVEQARTLADTCLRSYDRFVTGTIWEEAGIETFKYFGPKDNVNRPFCAAHVNHTYTLAEIKAMSNGSVRYANVWAYGGGPRCRHTWTPQVDSTTEKQTPETPKKSKAPTPVEASTPGPARGPTQKPKPAPAKNIIFQQQVNQ